MDTLTRFVHQRSWTTLVVLGILIVPLTTPAAAVPIIAGGLTDKYGTLDQNTVEACKDDANKSFSCGPTAAVNSFVFLQNMYPHIYDQLLVPDLDGDGIDVDDMKSVAETLAQAAYMDCVAALAGASQGGLEGVTLENFIKGKRKYIEEQVPNQTIYKAQSEFLPAALVDGRHKMRRPSFGFMFRELQHGEDVEIVVGRYKAPAGRTGGHMLTLTKLEWLDSGPNGTPDGQFGAEDEATMTFIDPLGGMVGTAEIRLGDGGRLLTNYDFAVGEARVIDAVISESPGVAPEPGMTLLFAVSLLAFGRAARRRALCKTS